MRKLLIPAAVAAAFLFVAGPSEAKAQVVVQYGTPVYGYAPVYGQYVRPYYQPYYGGSGVTLSTGGLSLSFGNDPYYGGVRGYGPYYGGSRYGWGGDRGWYGGNRGYYGGGRGYSGYRGGYRR